MSNQKPDLSRTRAVLDGLDKTAGDLEAYWGVDRLRLLVSDDTRAKFDRQRTKLNDAIVDNRFDDIRHHAEAMRRGWSALDKEARSLDAKPLDPTVWEIRLPSGKVAALVRTESEARAVTPDDRFCEVWTLPEFGRLIEGPWRDIGKAKQAFPGAIVSELREKEDFDDICPF